MENKLTAEQVLSNVTGIPEYRIKANDNGEYITKQGAIQAMSEYAQLESIEFAEWKAAEKWHPNTPFTGRYFRPLENGFEFATTSELYQIFKQEQQTTK